MLLLMRSLKALLLISGLVACNQGASTVDISIDGSQQQRSQSASQARSQSSSQSAYVKSASSIDHDMIAQAHCAAAPSYVRCDTSRIKSPYKGINFKNPANTHVIIRPNSVLSFPLYFEDESNAAGRIDNSNTWVGQGGGPGIKWYSRTPGGVPIQSGSSDFGDNCIGSMHAMGGSTLIWSQNTNISNACFVGHEASVVYLNIAMINASDGGFPDLRTALINGVPSNLPSQQGAVNNVTNTPAREYPRNGTGGESPAPTPAPTPTPTPTPDVSQGLCADAPAYVQCQEGPNTNPYRYVRFDPTGYTKLVVPAGKVLSWPLQFQADTNAIGEINNSSVIVPGGDYYERGVKWLSETPGGAPITNKCVRAAVTYAPKLMWSQNPITVSQPGNSQFGPCFIGYESRVLYVNVAFVRNIGYPENAKYPTIQLMVEQGIPEDLSSHDGHITSFYNKLLNSHLPNSANPNL